MDQNEKINENETVEENGENKEPKYSLNDDRRVKVLSPGMLVAKRFFRNRLAVTGISVLIFMFLFSFLGGLISPYGEKQQFTKEEILTKPYAGAKLNNEFRYQSVYDADGETEFKGLVKAYVGSTIRKGESSYTADKKTYTIVTIGDGLYEVKNKLGEVIGLAYQDAVVAADGASTFPYDFYRYGIEQKILGGGTFTAGGVEYEVDEDGDVTKDGVDCAYISRFIINTIVPNEVIPRDVRSELQSAIENIGTLPKDSDGYSIFEYGSSADGATYEYLIKFNPTSNEYEIRQATATVVFDSYSYPSKEHWLGTDGNGMDMLTRLMYGGRVSLMIGFIVVFIETFIGMIFGGISGFFGGWVDNLIMRIVDIFYCLPTTPLLIMLGAMFDEMEIPPQTRMIYLMLILGFLGWPSIARLVRGQILSLREQEFMTATEACGLSTYRRIFKHLVPNVIPQLIVTMSMGLGGTILTEATLSFLGLGVRYPFASWGNIINDVTNTFVLTTYTFVWIPAGVLLLATVLAFNLVGDGLRDAFDPKMKR